MDAFCSYIGALEDNVSVCRKQIDDLEHLFPSENSYDLACSWVHIFWMGFVSLWNNQENLLAQVATIVIGS
jgi:hypothetical protein